MSNLSFEHTKWDIEQILVFMMWMKLETGIPYLGKEFNEKNAIVCVVGFHGNWYLSNESI